MGADLLRQPLARERLLQLEARIVGNLERQHPAHRLAQRCGVGIRADHRQPEILARHAAQRPHQVVDPLAPLEPPGVEDPKRMARSVIGVALARGRRSRIGVADLDIRGERVSAVEAPVGAEDVATLPDQPIGVGEGEALHRVQGL
jgi:hypothetical protein